MIDRAMKLSPHFTLGEMVPLSCTELPPGVLGNLRALAALLEDVRAIAGAALVIHDAYRPPGHNEAVGGIPTSDHLTGCAADWHTAAAGGSWEQATVATFRLVRDNLRGRFGQLILEDHREHYRKPGKLWAHLSVPTPKHPGENDPTAVLVSHAPGQYARLDGEPTA